MSRSPSDLLGAHVRRGSDRESGIGDLLVTRRRIERPADAEIGDQRLAVDQENVLRLHVAVDDPVPMGEIEGEGHLPGDPHCFLNGELPLAREPVAQALAFDVGHGEPEVARALRPRTQPRRCRAPTRCGDAAGGRRA